MSMRSPWDCRIITHREDLRLAQGCTDSASQRLMLRDIASAAESGWDFSSRWFADGRSLATIRTTQVSDPSRRIPGH